MVLKKYLKKFISFFTILSMLAALTPFTALAAPAVSTLEPTDITTDSVTFRGTYNDRWNESIIYGAFILREVDTGVLSGEFSVQCPTSNDTVSYTRGGLKAGTKYTVEFKVYFGTGIPNEASGGTVQFITDGASISGNSAVATPTLSTYDSNSMDASSSYTLGSNVYVSEVGFVYSSSNASPELDASNCLKVTANTTTPFSARIYNLTYGNNYYVRAYVRYSNSATLGSNTSTIYSNTAIYNGTGYNSGIPTLQTVSASFQNGQIYAKGTITSIGNSGIQERGFVYSQYNSTPTTSDYRYSSSSTSTDFENYFTPQYTSSSDTYYVRAYAINANGTGYGEVRTTNVNYNLPTVTTMDITAITGFSADVRTNVTANNNYSITERGVVYSTSNSTPVLYASDSKYVIPSSGSSSTGELVVKLNELEQNTRYYVRAFARNSNGIAYGDIKNFTTSKDSSVTTVDATAVKGTSATAGGKINSDNGYTIQERGVVYSKTVENPTLNDNKVSDPNTGQGSFEVQLINLTSESKYYYRAFMRTTQGTSYGEAKTFTTTGSYIATVIEFKTADAKVISTQTIDSTNRDFVTVADLTPPTGYSVVNSTWRHEVTGTAAVTVLIAPSGGAIGSGTGVEKAFMESTGSLTFAPNRQITRVEVAQMIYALLGNGAASFGSNYTDVPANYYAKSAIDFCTANKYMQGYPEDKSFKPERTITRAELAVVLNTVYKLTNTGAADKFSDISNHWGRSFINTAAANNIITGYPDGTFKPEATATRAEACVLFSNASRRSLQPLGSVQFTDVPASHWAYKYIMNAAIAQ